MQSISEKNLKALHDRIATLEKQVARQPASEKCAEHDDRAVLLEDLTTACRELRTAVTDLETENEALKNTIAEQAETILSISAGKQPEPEASDPEPPHTSFDEEGD